VRNEAKLGGTGVCGQRPSSCGAWPGRRVKRAKRTQFGPRAREWARAGGRSPRSEDDCAKRSQTWEEWGIWTNVVLPVVARPGVKHAKTNQISRLWIGDCGLREAARRRVPETKCAKRTQFRPAGGSRRRPGAQDKPNRGAGAQIADCGLEEVSGGPGAKRHCMPGQPRRRQNAQNEPNLRAGARDGGLPIAVAPAIVPSVA
jgi:hypothetical protein